MLWYLVVGGCGWLGLFLLICVFHGLNAAATQEDFKRFERTRAQQAGYGLILLAIALIVAIFCPSPAAADTVKLTRYSTEELAVLADDEPPRNITEELLGALSDDPVVLRRKDDRNILVLKGEAGDEFILSFSEAISRVTGNIQLGRGGLRRRFTLVKPKNAANTPIYLDLIGPAINGGAGIKITIRF